MPSSTREGDLGSGATILRLTGDSLTSTRDVAVGGSSCAGIGLDEHFPGVAALALLCCNFFNFSLASIAANFNCSISSSSSPSPSVMSASSFAVLVTFSRAARNRPRRFGVVADRFIGDRFNASYFLRPLGELSKAARGDIGGHEVSVVILSEMLGTDHGSMK
jgi:hypothetical protein